MKVILKQDLDNLGMAGEVVDVKAGYARNYLLPRGIALEANTRNVRQLAHQQRIADVHRLRVEAAAHEQKKGLDGLFLTVERRSGPDGKLFGAVTSRDVVEMLAEREFAINKRRVQLSEPIKRVGEHVVTLRLDQGINAEIKVIVRGIEVAPEELEPHEMEALAADQPYEDEDAAPEADPTEEAPAEAEASADSDDEAPAEEA